MVCEVAVAAASAAVGSLRSGKDASGDCGIAVDMVMMYGG